MATNTCPLCGKPIAADDINIKEGVALCRACGKLSRLADLVDQPAIELDALSVPPAGCSFNESMDGFLIRASLRSIGAAIMTGAFCLFWNGIVSVFLIFAVAGLYTHFIGPLPAWFPMPTNHSGRKSDFGPDAPLGGTLFLCLFLTPFVLVGTGMFIACVMSIVGRIELTVIGVNASIRTGFGPLNWTRRFDASKVTRVSIGQSVYQTNGRYRPLIQIDADRTIKFGSGLPDERRAWMAGVLRQQLLGRKSGRMPSFAGK